MPEPLRAAVYCTSEAERAAAAKALGRGGEVTAYDGVLEGWLDGDGVRELSAQGIVVDPLDTTAAPAEARHDALERKTHCEFSDPGVQAMRATRSIWTRTRKRMDARSTATPVKPRNR